MQDVIEYFMEDFPGYFMGFVWDTVCNTMGYVTSKMIWLGSQFAAVLMGRMQMTVLLEPSKLWVYFQPHPLEKLEIHTGEARWGVSGLQCQAKQAKLT